MSGGIGFFIALLLLVFLIELLANFIKTNKSKKLINQSKNPPTPTITATQTQPTNTSPETTNISLSVVPLRTEYGIEGVPAPSYPITITASVPQNLVNQFSAYGASGYVVLGPKDWIGQGGVGADGNVSISLYPVNGSADVGPRVTIFIASTGTGNALFGAAPYFPWLQSHGKDLGLAPIPALVPGLQLTPITNYLNKYTLPDTPDGLEISGVVFSDAQDHIEDSLWSFSKMEVVLPQSQSNLATSLLDIFIDRQGFLKEGQTQGKAILKQADSQTPAAGVCAGPSEGNIATVTINEDAPVPRCLKVLTNQRLQVKNNTNKIIEVSLANLSTSLKPGKEYTFDSALGTFLAPGVHSLSVFPYGGPEIWLQGEEE